ncbi:MAG: Rrf2 family transcriptional regulator [Halioglobus sp.]|nr:Rrf2 family transcriptional regulator [Halioglobus sp.]
MRITTYTDYSIRVLMFLALKGDRQSTIQEISESYDISRNHLMKVVQQLGRKGYLAATRGKNGGLLLKRPPESIRVGALVRDMENDLALTECFGSSNRCTITPACCLRGVFAEALAAFFEALDAYTLADILPAERQPELADILHIN